MTISVDTKEKSGANVIGEHTVCAQTPTICHVVHTMSMGGAERLAYRFAIASQGEFRSVFACLDSLGNVNDHGDEFSFAITSLRRKPGFDISCGRRFRDFLRTHGVAIVHAHQYAPFFYSALARLHRSCPPILFTEHGRDYPDYRRFKRVCANRLLLRRKDRVIAVGKRVRDALINLEGIRPARIEVVYNGTNVSAFDAERSVRGEVRKELGLSNRQPVLIQVARINRLKDYGTSIRAIQKLARSLPDVVLLVVGDGECRDEIETQIEQLNLRQYVRLLGTRRDVNRLLQAADAFLLTSITEGIPLTLVEAMSTGLPCVSTDVGGVSEVVIDGQTGLLAQPSSATDIANKLKVMLQDQSLLAQFGKNAVERARIHFDERRMVDRYLDLYRSMLPQKQE